MNKISNSFKLLLAFFVFWLLTGSILVSPAMGVEFHRLVLQNLTGGKVNCTTIDLVIDHGSGHRVEGSRPNKSWSVGETKTLRLGAHRPCLKFSVKATCVSLLDGWTIYFSETSPQCKEYKAYFKINNKGELYLYSGQ